MYETIFNYEVKNEEFVIFWADLISNSFDYIKSDPFLLIKNIDNFIRNLDISLLTKSPSCHIRIIKILNRLVAEEKTHEKIISLKGFGFII